MTGVLDYIARLLGGVAFWVVVLPWQQALRVRAGAHVRVLTGGIYFKIPIFDVIQVESVRRRTSMVPTQTLSTADGHTVTVAAVIGYAIGDVERLYRSLHHAEDTIVQTAQGEIASDVAGRARSDVEPEQLGRAISRRMADVFADYGLVDVEVRITDFAYVRAIRLIQDTRWFHGRVLDTQGGSRGAS
jgi:regulator of protease activity HflC (stomatin/prohibitin superfamily)